MMMIMMMMMTMMMMMMIDDDQKYLLACIFFGAPISYDFVDPLSPFFVDCTVVLYIQLLVY